MRSLPSFIQEPKRYHTPFLKWHIARGVVFSLAMLGWTTSLVHLSLNIVTLVSLAIPIIVPLFAPLFLNEKHEWHYTLFTLGGMMGVALNLIHTCTVKVHHGYVCLAIGSMCLFAALDIVNKYLLERKESTDSMMFHTSVWSTLALVPLAMTSWHMPTPQQWVVLIVLSVGGDLFFFCWINALRRLPMSIVQPLRTMEFAVSCLITFGVTRRWPTASEAISCSFILLTTGFVAKRHMIAKPMSHDV